MKKLMSRLAVMLVLAVALTAVFAACGQNAGEAPGTTEETKPEAPATQTGEEELKGRVTLSGSTSVQPLAQALADEFNGLNPGVTVDIQVGGSSVGITNAYEKVTDIGNSSRDLKEEEKAWNLTEHKIAVDGIAVVINPANNVTDLTIEQIVKIFTGEITNWKDVGGDDKEIIVVTREPGSGTRGAFEEILKLTKTEKDANGNEVAVSLIRKDALVCNENGVVKATVASPGKEYSIGYMSLGYVDDTVKAIQVDGTEATVENIKAGSYGISRPFLMLTNGEMKTEVEAFIDFIMSSAGQDIVEANHYIRVDK